MSLKIIHTGHAGFIFVFNETVIVTDHWSDKYNPFENSWEKLESDNFDDETLNYLKNPDYVWCSHEHGDHYDPIYINSLENPKTKLILPRFSDHQFLNRVIKNGFDQERITEIDDQESLKISENISIIMLFEEPKYSNHSSLLLKFKEFTCLHNADTTPNKDFYDKFNQLDVANIDLFIGQYCNPTPYPWVFDMDPITKEETAIELHENAIMLHSEMCDTLNAKETIPCAGPAIVKNFSIQEFARANKLVYDKKENLDKIQRLNKSTKVHDLKSGSSLDYII